MLFKKKADYFSTVENVGIFENNKNTMYPQTVCAEIIRSHFRNAEKKPKALILGFDGARADSMRYLVKSTKEDISGKLFVSAYSAVNTLKKEGGLYLSYAGGEPSAPQETSTAQGWSAILTGVWGGTNGVLKHVPLKESCPTVLRELAEQGIKSAFLAEWADHFTITYKNEIAISKEKNLPLEFKKHDTDEILETSTAENIEGDTDCIFSVFEGPDYNGHAYGFGSENYRYTVTVCNLDRIAYRLMEKVKARPTYAQEDWLFLITSDHGGHGFGHGTQKVEDRTTFIACNKKI